MKDLEEFRYPFASAFEFFHSSYWKDSAALHLDFAWIAVLVIVARVLTNRRQSLGPKLLALYFGLTLYNNFAFQLVPGATLGDLFGIACAVYYGLLVLWKRELRYRISAVGTAVLCAGLLMSIHALVIAAAYPDLNADWAGLTRTLVILKVFVFGLCCSLFEDSVHDLDWLTRQVVNFAIVGLAAYAMQVTLLLVGIVPYGTFLDAGYVGFPAFGSVSIERGHFGKFMTPLFPFFLLGFLKHRRRFASVSFAAITLINFSASSLSFFAFYAVATIWSFKRKLLNVKVAAVALCIGSLVGTFVACTWQLWAAVATKIDGGGAGRGLNVFFSYVRRYPLGLSYGGSSLRIAPGLDEINSGVLAFITQESVIAPVLIIGFLFLVFLSYWKCRTIADPLTRKALSAGVLIMPFIFATDLLWFVPTIWLPMLFVHRLGRPMNVVDRHLHVSASGIPAVAS
jgi:hypothetical protein